MRHERDFTPDTGAFYGKASLHQHVLTTLEKIPDSAFLQGGQQKYVSAPSTLINRLLRRPVQKREMRCPFSWLTGYYDVPRMHRTALERYNFPKAFTEWAIDAYDTSDHPAAYARQLFAAIQPGTNVALVARIMNDLDEGERVPQALIDILKAHAPGNLSLPQILAQAALLPA